MKLSNENLYLSWVLQLIFQTHSPVIHTANLTAVIGFVLTAANVYHKVPKYSHNTFSKNIYKRFFFQ